MNTNQFQANQSRVREDVIMCANIYNVEGSEVVNYFNCNQNHFSAADMWRIEKGRKAVEYRRYQV